MASRMHQTGSDTMRAMHIGALLLVISVLMAACNSNGSERGALSAPTSSSTTSSTPSTSTSTTSSSTTTSTSTTTTTASTSATTTTTAPSTFDVPRGSPMAFLDSFTGTTEFTMDLGEGLEIGVMVDAVYVGEAYSCAITTSVGALGLVNRLVVTPDSQWYDDGSGLREYRSAIPEIGDLMGMCAASPSLWQGFYDPTLVVLGGDPEIVNGIDTLRIDLLDESEMADALGFLPSDMGVGEFVMWIADPEMWPVRIRMVADIGPEAFADMLGTELSADAVGSLTFDIELDDFDDPTLVVEVPGLGPVGPGA